MNMKNLPPEFRAAYKRELEWEKSPDGIYQSTDIRSATLPKGDTPPENHIIDVLTALPASIRRKVQENATFFVTYSDSYVMHGTDKWVILLNFASKETDRARRTTVAHEIGHLMDYLKDPNGNGGYLAEKRADDFSEKYGFGRAYTEKKLQKLFHQSYSEAKKQHRTTLRPKVRKNAKAVD
jgi:hypothetical protein